MYPNVYFGINTENPTHVIWPPPTIQGRGFASFASELVDFVATANRPIMTMQATPPIDESNTYKFSQLSINR
jgi:hypothetical protein